MPSENKPGLDTVGWLKLALKVAENDLDNLASVFTLAHDELRKRGVMPEVPKSSGSDGVFGSVQT